MLKNRTKQDCNGRTVLLFSISYSFIAETITTHSTEMENFVADQKIGYAKVKVNSPFLEGQKLDAYRSLELLRKEYSESLVAKERLETK